MAENTTLSIPKDFAEHLRSEFEGSNDWQRLHNWAQETYKDNDIDSIVEEIKEIRESYKNSITQEDIRRACEEAIRNVQR